MKYAVKFPVLMALAIAAFASLLVVGCKSAPDLSKADALSMIEAYYSAQPATGINITVNNDGMVQGATAKYWNRTKIYPNRYWADFTLTPDGKKIIKLADGSDTIKWRPESPTDSSFSVVVTTVAANRPKPRDLGDIQSIGSKTKTVTFTEAVDFTGVPQPLQDIAHNPGNKLTDSKTADFVLENGAWKLQSIQ